ncbi:hypothetical protein SAMN05444920_10449 [Nonomuraea solani]|uniref:Uncharacterized protein n=1 Tax=Nonomuraea solani TaxID=1144553 RepID=A0A1H6CJA8_9ACTN|nr:hypothetical protein [Nonomuraea solani]SEG73064.1 hypothetical protein SAMN05444920_10449 [Nonomuraea solani]
MTDERLRELFDDLAETLPEGSSRADELWWRGTRSRSRRRWTVAGAVALVVAGVVVFPEPVERGVAVAPAPAVDTVGGAELPALVTALPERWADIPVVTAVPGPVLALAEFGDGRIYALKSGGRIPLDVKPPLTPNSLAPDGTMAAFPRKDEVVVVDLVIGQARRYPVPGANEVVLWRGERLLVEQERANYLLDLATGEARRQRYKGFTGVAGFRDLRIVSGKGGRTVIQENGSEVPLDVRGITDGPGEHGWQRDGLVATSAAAHSYLADAATGQVIRTLRCEKSCPVRGWLGHGTVIVENEGRLLGWNIATGALSRVADLPDGVAAYSLRGG